MKTLLKALDNKCSRSIGQQFDDPIFESFVNSGFTFLFLQPLRKIPNVMERLHNSPIDFANRFYCT